MLLERRPIMTQRKPSLSSTEVGDVVLWTDPDLPAHVVIGFSERSGGASSAPFASLNLASHVGDDPVHVDENRVRLLSAAGLGSLRARLTTAEQIHGEHVAVVGESEAGAGAYTGWGAYPLASTDALVTASLGIPLMLCFADCVPVVLVAPGPAVAVLHAGWRGALASLPGKTARELVRVAGCDPASVAAYIGAHIAACHYNVAPEIMSQFCNTFGTFARADSGALDLDAVVTASLVDAGVSPCSIARLGTCTADATDRFFSHRAEHGRTGRHSAFACIVSDAL